MELLFHVKYFLTGDWVFLFLIIFLTEFILEYSSCLVSLSLFL